MGGGLGEAAAAAAPGGPAFETVPMRLAIRDLPAVRMWLLLFTHARTHARARTHTLPRPVYRLLCFSAIARDRALIYTARSLLPNTHLRALPPHSLLCLHLPVALLSRAPISQDFFASCSYYNLRIHMEIHLIIGRCRPTTDVQRPQQPTLLSLPSSTFPMLVPACLPGWLLARLPGYLSGCQLSLASLTLLCRLASPRPPPR